MGPSKSVLLVDSDARSLRVLEVSLKKAGFRVHTAETVEAALQTAAEAPPDLVVTDTRLADGDGFALARKLKADPSTAETAIIFLSLDTSAEAKISAINAGSDFYLTKPVLVRDILSRIHELIERQQTEAVVSRPDRPGNLSGTLANLGVIDLLQLMESGNRSGVAHLSTDPQRSGGFVSEANARGTMFFSEGKVIDARFGDLGPLDAIYRMLLWDDGVFELEFKPVSRADVIDTSTPSILLEGMRRVDEWSQFASQVPPLATRLTLDYSRLAQAYPTIEDSMQQVLQLFDGRRTLLDVIDDAPVSDINALAIICELHSQGVFQAADRSTSPPLGEVEAWLSTGISNRRRLPDEVPSVLGDAVIPSPRTPSEILGLRDPRSADGPMPMPSVIDVASTPSDQQPPVALSRHVVPSHRPAAAMPPAPAPERPSSELQRPTLTVRRVSSIVEPAASAAAPTPTMATLSWDFTPRLDVPALASEPPPKANPSIEQAPTATDAPGPAPATLGAMPGRAEPSVLEAATLSADLPVDELVAAPTTVDPGTIPLPYAGFDSEEQTLTDNPVAPPTVDRNAADRQAAAVLNPAPTAPVQVESNRTDGDTVPTPSPPTNPVMAASDGLRAAMSGVENDEASRDFFQETGKSDTDIHWDDTASWQQRWPGLMFVAAVALAVIALIFGGPGRSDNATTVAAGSVEPTSAGPAGPADTATPPGPAGPAPAAEALAVGPTEAAAVAVLPARARAAATAPIAAPRAAQPERAKPTESTETKVKRLISAGNLHLRKERYSAARRSFRSALASDPQSAAAHAGLAMVWVNLEKDNDAQEAAKQALALDRGQPQAHLALALVYTNAGDSAKAKRYYESFLKYQNTGKMANEVRRVLANLP